MRAPERRMTSGIRNPPPISTNSPRATMTSLPFARGVNIKSTAAAPLLTIAAASAPPAASAPRRELQRRVAAGDGGGGLRRGGRQGRPAEVRVEDHPRGIDDRPQARTPQLLNHALDSRPATSRLSDDPAATLLIEDALYREADQGPAVSHEQRAPLRLLEQLMDAGQSSQGCHCQPPIANGAEVRMNRTTGV